MAIRSIVDHSITWFRFFKLISSNLINNNFLLTINYSINSVSKKINYNFSAENQKEYRENINTAVQSLYATLPELPHKYV
jgi:hypothetical protein